MIHFFFELCLKQSTLKLGQMTPESEFNPLYMNYFLMNWLVVSPRDVVNTGMLTALLEGEPSEVKQEMLTHLFEGYDQSNSEAVLAAAVPRENQDVLRIRDGRDPALPVSSVPRVELSPPQLGPRLDVPSVVVDRHSAAP